jgi:hypothetical protein
VKKIFGEDLQWKGKLLVFTWHFKEEYEKVDKPLDFIIEILDKGEHHRISKNENKFNVFYPFQRRYLCLSYVEHENIILIHIKPITNKPEEK